MKTCDACGMPAPSSTDACGYCARPFGPTGPVTYRLSEAAEGYRWTVDGDEVAYVAWHDGTWDYFDLHGTRPAMTLVPVDVDGATRVALVDHRSRLVCTYTPSTENGPGIGVVRDGYDRIVLLARGDGPSGIHLIDSSGNVVALAGRTNGARMGLDILVLGRAAEVSGHPLVLGVTLLLELARIGELRRVA